MSHDIRIPLKRRTLGSRWRGLKHVIDAHLLRERHAIVHVPALDLRAGLEFWVDQGGELRRLDAAGVDALLRSSADDPGFQQDLFCLRPGLGLSHG